MSRPPKTRWTRKSDTSAIHLPIPTQVISNEEFLPPQQTTEQRLVEHRLLELADRSARKLNITRRQFLATSGGMAAAFIAMNSVFGRFFNVEAREMFDCF